MGGHRKKPNEIVSRKQFVRDIADMQKVLLGYSGGLRVSSPHYRAVQDVQEALSRAVVTVMGREPVFVGHGDVGPEALFYFPEG